VNNDGQTAVSIAAKAGHYEAVQALTCAGAALNLFNSKHFGPLHLAILNGHLSVAEFLVGKGAAVYDTEAVYLAV